MQLTQEQQTIIQTISNKDCNFVKINAVSGAGKTSSLIAIAQHLNVKQGLYISYNKAIATEASEKFGTGIQCKTIHSLAYGFTVKHFSLKLVSTLKARIITERIPYIRKALLLETLSKYFLSRHITIQSFVESEYAEGIFSQEDVDLMKNYFIKMKEGKCDCSHDFYLKLFHILLHHGIVKTPEYELLMLDEAGDVNGTSLEIFRLIKATKRIMVGDSCLPGNSKIKTSTGWRNILSIVKDIESKKKVKVWSYNHNSDTFEFKKAIGSLRTGKKQCYKLKTTRSSLECTANHKIATPYGYKRLDELKIGDLIHSEPVFGSFVITVDVITSIEKTRTTETYDIEVEDNHNFIASMTAQKSTACGILVHNCQNIYSFNNTINGFKALENEGKSLKLTQSFRVSDQLAPIIEEFCHQYLDSTMEFRGVHYDSKPAKEDQTIFYIARTNGGIIEKMIELEEEHTPYNLTRPVKAIFQLPLILLMLSKDWKTEIYIEEYKFLEHDAKEFSNDVDLQKHFKESILAYFANEHADDPSVMSAINLIMRFGPQKIFACNKKALEHEKHHETHKVTITSAHSSKGLQADIVHILPDMNGALDKIVAKQHEYVDNMIQIDKTSNKNWTFDPIKYEYFDKKQPNMELLSKQAQEEFRLYYVAVTRTKYDVYDAEWLSEPDFITMFPEDSSINLRGTFED